jgi:hypothetical protein
VIDGRDGVALTYTDLRAESGEVGEEFCYSHVCLGYSWFSGVNERLKKMCVLTVRFGLSLHVCDLLIQRSCIQCLPVTCAFESACSGPTSNQG